MKVITCMEHTPVAQNVAIALGTFDGVHLGHQKVIGRAVQFAKSTGGSSAVFTFENHPLSVLKPDQCPPLITDLVEKERIFSDLGVDLLFSVPFDAELLRLSPVQFIDKLLEIARPELVVVGPNYSFGYRSSGTPELLDDIGREKGFRVEVQTAVYIDGQMVSSTRIRNNISSGALDQAVKLLGRPFQLSGRVVHGDKRGRTIGFPTANLAIMSGQLIPADGVYAVRVVINGRHYPAVANVGNNPTFKNQSRRIEVYILDFNADLYGQNLRVEFYKKLRDEQVFLDISELKQRINFDVTAARQYFGQNI